MAAAPSVSIPLPETVSAGKHSAGSESVSQQGATGSSLSGQLSLTGASELSQNSIRQMGPGESVLTLGQSDYESFVQAEDNTGLIEWLQTQGKTETGKYLVQVAETGQMVEVQLIESAEGKWDVKMSEQVATAQEPSRAIAGSADADTAAVNDPVSPDAPASPAAQAASAPESSSSLSWQSIKDTLKSWFGMGDKK